MANEYRSGADGSSIALGIQQAYGNRIADFNNMLPFFFPVSNISIGETQQVEENDLITAFGADSETEIGQLWADGNFTTRILVDHFFEIIRGILNPELTASAALLAVANDAQPTDSANGVPSGVLTIANASPMVTHPGETTPYLFPSRLRLVLTGTPTLASNARLRIVGKRLGGRNDALDLHLDQEDVEGEALTATGGISTKFWHEIDSVTARGITGGTSPTWELQWEPQTYFLEVKFRTTNVQFPGWTALILAGGSPATVQDLTPTGLNITANAQGMTAQIECLGVRYEELRTIAGGLFSEQVELSDAEKAHYEVISTKSMPGWAGALLFGDDVLKYNGLELNVNRNLQFVEGVDGSQFRTGLAPSDNRQVTFTPTTLFETGTELTDTFQRWQRIFRNNERTPLRMVARASDGDGRRFQFEASTPSSQLTESPRANVEGPGPMQRRLPFKALPTSGQTSEITFKFWTQRQTYVA